MAIVCDQDNDVCVITVVGDLSGDDAATLYQSVEDGMRRGGAAYAFVVDLRDCEFIDRAGVDSLLRARRRCTEQGGQFGLANVDPVCRQTLETTKSASRFDYHHDLATALRATAPILPNPRRDRGLQSGPRRG